MDTLEKTERPMAWAVGNLSEFTATEIRNVLVGAMDRLQAEHPDYSFVLDPEMLGPDEPVTFSDGSTETGWVLYATATRRDDA